MNILEQHGVDPSIFCLGNLCKKGHDFFGTGKSLRYIKKSEPYKGQPTSCFECLQVTRAIWRSENVDRKSKMDKAWRDANVERCKQNKKAYYQANKDVIKRRARDWELAHPERVRERARALRVRYRDKNIARLKAYRKEHSEKVSAYFRALYVAKKDVITARTKRYSSSDRGKESRRIREARRRARLESVHATRYSIDDLRKKEEYFLGKCAYCCSAKSTAWDHFLPVSKGGPDTLGNIVPACRECNSRKNAKDPWNWFSQQGFFSQSQWKKILRSLNKGVSNHLQMPLF